MKLTTHLIVLSVLFSGCVSLQDDASFSGPSASPGAKVLNALVNIKMGMTRQEVTAAVKKEILIGYKIEGGGEKLEPITLAQPFKEEVLSSKGRTYQVLYYYTSVNRPDDLVADDELTPLIFENEALIGKGLADLDRIKRL